MRKSIALLLTAVLVFGMIPASILSAFAADNGVMGNTVPNQSIDNAPLQYTPESVSVDGVLNDTAWAEEDWQVANDDTGTWKLNISGDASTGVTVKEPVNTDLSYRYQLKNDYEYLFCAIEVNTVADSVITVWLKDDKKESTAGCTDKFVFTVSNGTVEEQRLTYKDSDYVPFGDPEGILPAEKYLFASKASENSVIIEFRSLLTAFAETDSALSYFVSVKIGDDELYHPMLPTADEEIATVPDYDYWPNNAAVISPEDMQHSGTNSVPSDITVDGYLDEAAWADMTDFYTSDPENLVDFKENTDVNGNSVQKNLVSFDNIKYNDGAFLPPSTVPESGTDNYNEWRKYESNTAITENISFKYDIRTDSEYVYGAVVAYVPDFEEFELDNCSDSDHTVKVNPDLYIYFYNQTNDSALAADLSGWEVTSFIQLAGATGGYTACTTNENSDGYTFSLNWASANTPANNGYKGARVQGDGNLWYFEFKIKLEAVAGKDSEGNINDFAYSLYIADRLWKNTFSGGFYRNEAWTGLDNGSANHTAKTHYNWLYANRIDSSEECVGNNSNEITIDGNLSKTHWAAIVGGDAAVSAVARGTDTDTRDPGKDSSLNAVAQHYTYSVTADHEYLYGSIIVQRPADEQWGASDADNESARGGTRVRLWVNAYDNTYDNVGNDYDFSAVLDFYVTNTSMTTTLGNNGIYSVRQGSVMRYDRINNKGRWAYGNKGELDADCKIAFPMVSGDAYLNINYAVVEFKVALSDVGIVPDLYAEENQYLFSYFVSIEDSSGYGYLHPNTNGTVLNNEWDEKGTEYAAKVYYNGVLVTDFDPSKDSFMLDSITIDGKLEESLWYNENNRIYVDSDNAAYKNEAFTSSNKDMLGSDLSFSYVLYAGDNCIYGAAEINTEAIIAGGADQKGTKLELWIDNIKVTDNPIWEGHTEDYLYNYFNFYLTKDPVSGNTVDCAGFNAFGGSTPNIDKDYLKWGMTTANGKTYIEFMLSTTGKTSNITTGNSITSLSLDPDLGFEYFIKVSHPDEEGNYRSLTYPENKNDFFITHYNTYSPEGAGVIFTDTDTYYTTAHSMNWWTHVHFEPVSGLENVYVVKNITKGLGGQGTKLYTADTYASSVSDNGFIYTINSGNNYYDLYELYKNDPTNANYSSYAAYVQGWYAHENYKSTASQTMYDWANTWEVGDMIQIEGITIEDIKNKTVPNGNYSDTYDTWTWDGTTTTYTDEHTGKEYTGVNVYTNTPTYREALWYEDGYDCTADSSFYANINRNSNLPDMNTWNSDCAGKVEKLEFFAPEKITIDGVISTDTGWADDKWITVNENINGTTQESTSYADEFSYKYQLRTDGEYLYVAAVLDGVDFETEKPEFRLWINTDGSKSYTHAYVIGNGTTTLSNVEVIFSHEEEYQADNDVFVLAEDYTTAGANGNISYADKSLNWTVNSLRAFQNNDSGNPDGGLGENSFTEKTYLESALFGYTDEIQESVGGKYYPDVRIETRSFIFGTESAVMAPDQTGENTVVEFKVKLDEFGGEDGFEYFVSAARYPGSNGYTLFHPSIAHESNSGDNYYKVTLPVWNWYEATSAKVDSEVLESISLRNGFAPVTTLGAKITDSYTAVKEDGTTFEGKAIRFGALYNEDYIRNAASATDTYNPQDITSYWDATQTGMLIIPTVLLQDEDGNAIELNRSTPKVLEAPADYITNWVSEGTPYGSNFADYESFVFYVPVYNIPADTSIKFSFRSFIDFRNGSGTYYGKVIDRSYDLVYSVTGTSNSESSDPA